MIELKFSLEQLPSDFVPDIQIPGSPITEEIKSRIEFISKCLVKTLEGSESQVKEAIDLCQEWMTKGTVVRLVGAGRAKLAGAVPMNRLAHGGARLYINDDNLPMPHSIHGGGIIAVSASGKTPPVLEILEHVYTKTGNIRIIGIANKNAVKFKQNCHIFIGIDEDINDKNPLTALADTGEQVICQLLDSIVAAAGKKAKFDDTRWRLGHEDIGSTGPYGIPVIENN